MTDRNARDEDQAGPPEVRPLMHVDPTVEAKDWRPREETKEERAARLEKQRVCAPTTEPPPLDPSLVQAAKHAARERIMVIDGDDAADELFGLS